MSTPKTERTAKEKLRLLEYRCPKCGEDLHAYAYKFSYFCATSDCPDVDAGELDDARMWARDAEILVWKVDPVSKQRHMATVPAWKAADYERVTL